MTLSALKNPLTVILGLGSLVSGLVLGCSLLSPDLSPSQQRAMDAHKCYHAALEPVVGELADQFLEAALAGGDLTKALLVHGVRIEDVLKTAKAFNQCAVDAASPTETAGAENLNPVRL